MQPVRVLELWVDYVSVFSYLGSVLAARLARESGLELRLQPVFLPALLAHYGQKGSAEIPAKRAYMFKHALCLAQTHGVELEAPLGHPFSSLLALRATLLCSEPARPRVAERVFRAAWVEGQDVADPRVVRAALDAAGQTGEALVARASSGEAKELLRQNTERAIEQGLFGVPSFVLDGEMFWGCDALPHLQAALQGQRGYDPARFARWLKLPQPG